MRYLLAFFLLSTVLSALQKNGIVTDIGYSPNLTYSSNSIGSFPDFNIAEGYKSNANYWLLGFSVQTTPRSPANFNSASTLVGGPWLGYRRAILEFDDWEFHLGGQVGLAAREYDDFSQNQILPTYLGLDIQTQGSIQYLLVDLPRLSAFLGVYFRVGGRIFSGIPSEYALSTGINFITIMDIFN